MTMTTKNPKTMTGLHLFYNTYSNCSQRVQLLLAEKGIEAEMHVVDLMRGAQLTEEYHQISPRCQVPAIVHNGTPMEESCDIMKYLEKEFPENSFTPVDSIEQSQMDYWLNIAGSTHISHIVNYVYAYGYGRLPTPDQWAFYQKHVPHRTKFHKERREGLVATDRKAATALIDEQFTQLEETLGKTPWLAGNTYSLADIAWYPNAWLLQLFGYSLEKFPNMQAWMKRIEQRPAYQSGIKNHLKNIPNFVLRLVGKLIRKFGNRS